MKSVAMRVLTPACAVVLVAGSAVAAPVVDGAARAVRPTVEFIPHSLRGEERVHAAEDCLVLRSGVVRVNGKGACAETVARADGRMIVQLDGPLTKEKSARLAEAGVSLGQYLPTHAYVVKTGGLDAEAFDALEFVRWHGRFERGWKLASSAAGVAGAQDYVTPERRALEARGEAALVLSLFEGADAAATVEALGAMPGVVVAGADQVGGNVVLTVVAPKGRVVELTDLADVMSVEEAPEATARMATSTWVDQSNVLNFTPVHDNGVTGAGQIVSVIDLPVDADNCAFEDEEGASKFVAILDNGFPSGHGTAVCSIIAGDGGSAGSPNADMVGLAYDAELVFNRIPSFSESALISDLEAAHGLGARIHSNSWGEDSTSRNFYNVWARAIDVFTHEHEEDLVVFASTNLTVLRTPENSRNVLATAASFDTPAQDVHATGGIGPTGDGRRKPELVAPGSGVRAAAPNTCNDGSSGLGTSFACPQIAAGGALVRQYYMDGFYPSGAANAPDGFTPTGALMKATLLNSGVDMTGESGYPTNLEGWGRMLLDEALHFAGEARTMRATDVRHADADALSTGGVYEMEFDVTSSGEKLKTTLVYTDAPAAPAAAFVPVNDLDLEVVSPSGATYLGNVFMGGVSVIGGAADTLNNVEQVHVANPETGTWTVRVLGTAVNEGPQGFAIVTSGAVAEAAGPCVGDLDGDGSVTSADLGALLAAWGSAGPADFDGSGTVGNGDLGILLASWGDCP